jgi:hypothetical protein
MKEVKSKGAENQRIKEFCRRRGVIYLCLRGGIGVFENQFPISFLYGTS